MLRRYRDRVKNRTRSMGGMGSMGGRGERVPAGRIRAGREAGASRPWPADVQAVNSMLPLFCEETTFPVVFWLEAVRKASSHAAAPLEALLPVVAAVW